MLQTSSPATSVSAGSHVARASASCRSPPMHHRGHYSLVGLLMIFSQLIIHQSCAAPPMTRAIAVDQSFRLSLLYPVRQTRTVVSPSEPTADHLWYNPTHRQ